MPFTLDDFRAAFPEFGDSSAYPDAMIAAWKAVAERTVANEDRWGELLDFGRQLALAHYLVQARQNVAASFSDKAPGSPQQVAASKTVGSVSVTFDPASTATEDGGHWNATSYGRQFLDLRRLFGAGGLQLC